MCRNFDDVKLKGPDELGREAKEWFRGYMAGPGSPEEAC